MSRHRVTQCEQTSDVVRVIGQELLWVPDHRLEHGEEHLRVAAMALERAVVGCHVKAVAEPEVGVDSAA